MLSNQVHVMMDSGLEQVLMDFVSTLWRRRDS